MTHPRPKSFAPFCATLLAVSCAPHRPFVVVPGTPDYLLRSPDLKDTPFPEVKTRFTPSGIGWVDLRAQMGLRLENAYFREGSVKRTVDEFIGTAAAEYDVTGNGSLKLISLQTKIPQRPQDQAAVETLLPAELARYRFHRYFYQIVFSRKKEEVSGAVLLGARSPAELEMLAARLAANPDSVCSSPGGQCAVFPELCSVSVQMEIAVNGEPRRVLFGSAVGAVAQRPKSIELMRNHSGRPRPVQIDAADLRALALPLLPGDRLTWEPLPPSAQPVPVRPPAAPVVRAPNN